MSPELINAIKERLAANQNRQEIESAVLEMGYAKEVFDAAFTRAEHDIKTQAPAMLPEVTTLFLNGWKFAIRRPDVLVLLLLPLAFQVIATSLFDRSVLFSGFPLSVIFSVFFLISVVYIVTFASALFIVSRSDGEDATISTALHWTAKNSMALLSLYILSGLVILGASFMFIIPGLVVAITVIFAQYAYVADNKRGVDALVASRQVFTGRWFMVAAKVVGFILLSFAIMILIEMVASFILDDGGFATLGSEFLVQFTSAVMSLITLHAMFHLYQALKGSTVEITNKKGLRIWYWILSGIGFFGGILLFTFMIFFNEESSWLEDAATPLEDSSARDMPASFIGFSAVTLAHANEQNGSYEGVCEKLVPLASVDGEVVCNSNETSWALEVVDMFGGRYCADTTTPGKAIATPLGTKTECIAVGE